MAQARTVRTHLNSSPSGANSITANEHPPGGGNAADMIGWLPSSGNRPGSSRFQSRVVAEPLIANRYRRHLTITDKNGLAFGSVARYYTPYRHGSALPPRGRCWQCVGILADTHIRQGRSRNLRDAPVDRAVRGQHEAPPLPIWCVCRVPGNGEAIDQGFVSLEVGDDRAGRSNRGYRSRPRALARGVGRQSGGVDVVGEVEHHTLRVHPECRGDHLGVHGVDQFGQAGATHRFGGIPQGSSRWVK